MAEDKNTLELISDITEFNDLHEFMQDEHLDKALAIVVKLLMNPDVPSAKAPPYYYGASGNVNKVCSSGFCLFYNCKR